MLSWNCNTLATWCEELTYWKRPWCWEGLGAGGEGDNRAWDGWMASPTWWTWVWVNSRSWWWIGRPGVLQSMGSQRVGHNWATERIILYLFIFWTNIDWALVSPYSPSVQSLSCVQLFVTPWTTACQAPLSIANSQSLLKLMSIESVMLSNHLICHPLLLPSTFPSIRVFSNKLALHIRWPKGLEFHLQRQSFQWIFRVDFL